MDKKVTVKDVAREAGVSVATVSYIMNNRTDQKISDSTRKKVLQIANLLNYRPSHAAVSLATGRTNVIGVAYSLDPDTPSRNMEINIFVNMTFSFSLSQEMKNPSLPIATLMQSLLLI